MRLPGALRENFVTASRLVAVAGAVVAMGALTLLGCSGQAGQTRTEVGDSGIGLAEGSAVDAENEVPSTAPEAAAPADTASESAGSPGGDADQSGEHSGEFDAVGGSEQYEEPEPAVESVDTRPAVAASTRSSYGEPERAVESIEAPDPAMEPDPAAKPVGAVASGSDDGLALEVVEELAPSGSAGGARQDEPLEAVETEESGGLGSPSSAQGEVYMWHDGDRTVGARLQLDLVVVGDGTSLSKDDIVVDTGEGQIVSRGADGAAGADGAPSGHPVFLSESGTLMALPGGVILVLDEDWGTDGTAAFFARNSISLDRVSELSYLANGFLVETDPVFASLDLANALAGQAGVELSSPNWWRARTTK